MSKSCTTDMRALDVRKIQRDGCLKPGCNLNWTWSRHGEQVASIELQVQTDKVTLIYQSRPFGGEPKSMNYPVRLDWTACHYGRQRVWWLCPAAGCGRRVAVLYGGALFACRHCQNLTYKSQQETPGGRAYRIANKLRARLGWVPGVIHGPGRKPKGMHWRTFWRMHASHDAHVLLALGSSAAVMDRLHSKLKRMTAYS